jgi:hypothetical protein
MARARKKVNVADIVIGVILMTGIPLITHVALAPDTPEPAAAAGAPADPKVLPLTLEELNDLNTEYVREYRENARLFLQRSIDPKTQEREQSWARQVLIRAKKGLTDLQTRIKGSNRFTDTLPELERCLMDIDAELKALPPAGAGAPAPAATPAAPSAAAPPSPAK